jgi:pilus assembly protein CpaB
MNGRRILMALGLASIVSFLSCWVVARRLVVSAAPGKLPDLIYVAPARAIQPGEVLKLEDLSLVSWPGNHPIEGGQTRVQDLVGREALFPIAKGRPLIDRDLSTPGSGPGLASKIPDGMRAVTLRSDEVVGVAGFIIPGSHLDVLVTYHMATSPEPITATVLQNVVALAAGHEVQPDPTGKPSDVTRVTLLLSLDDAQHAVLASSQGQIHFVLRNGGDQTTNGISPLQLSQLTGHPVSSVRVVVRSAPAAAPQPVSHPVEVILAGQSQNAGISR